MTKKHFIALAAALKAAKADAYLIAEIAAVCRRANPNFDMGRFIAAATAEEGP